MTMTPKRSAGDGSSGEHPVHTRGYWDAVQNGHFVLERCVECRRYAHPPVGACRYCGGHVEFVSSAGTGVIYSATKMFYQAVPTTIRTVPYWVAVVALDEQDGLRIVVPVEDTPDDQVRPDAPVEITIREVAAGGRRIPVAVVKAADPLPERSP